MNIDSILRWCGEVWDKYGDLILLGIGVVVLVAAIVALTMFLKAKDKADVTAKISALVVMAWTSEGVLATAYNVWHLPLAFVSATFFVFETMYAAAWFYAEASRRNTGSPGPAGWYMFVIGAVQGGIAAAGATMFSLGVMRVALPALSLGLMLILMCAPREGDSDTIKAKRAARAANRAATWAITPNLLLIRMGWMVAGEGTSATTAQLRRSINRMVAAADTIAIHSGPDPRKDPRRVRRARQRLRVIMRTATPSMIEQARRLTLQASAAEILIVPSTTTIDALRAHIAEHPEAALEPLRVDAQVEDQVADLTDPVADQVAPGSDPVALRSGDPTDRPAKINGNRPTIPNLLGGTFVEDPTPVPDTTDPVADPTDQVDADEEAGGPDTTARPQDDAMLLDWYREQLAGEFNAAINDPTGKTKVTAYKVGQIVGADRRQAERLISIVAVKVYGDRLAELDAAGNLTAPAVAGLFKVANGPADQIIRRYRDQVPGTTHA